MIINKKYSKNEVGIDYVVGDLHGCYSQLLDQLDAVNFSKSRDRLFSVGDLVDRGHENMECLRLILEDWFYPVQGNHECFLINSVVGNHDPVLWFMNGGAWHQGLSVDEAIECKELCQVLSSSVPLTITLETEAGIVGISHAQPPTEDWNHVGGDLSAYQIEGCIWSRDLVEYGNPETYKTKNIDFTIHGHTPKINITTVGNAVFIDTGSFIKEKNINSGAGWKGVVIHKVSDLNPNAENNQKG